MWAARARRLSGICLLLALFLFGTGSARAEQTPLPLPDGVTAELLDGLIPEWQETVIDYRVDVDVLADTDLLVTERIRYQTGTRDVRRGIVREIPTIDIIDEDTQRSYGVTILSVLRDGAPVPYTQTEDAGVIELRIGDERTPIEGRYEFEIAYRVQGGLRLVEEVDEQTPPDVQIGDVELYWDFIGDQWALPIQEAIVRVTGPAPAIAAQCLPSAAFQAGCVVDLNGGAGGATVMRARSVAPSASRSSLTGAIAWDPEVFTQIPAPVITATPQAAEDARAIARLAVTIPIGLLLIAVPVATAVVLRRRNAGAVTAATPVRYEPPQGVRPAQMQAGRDGAVNAAGIAATVADLAVRGHITVEEGRRNRLRRDDGAVITDTGPGRDVLLDWERSLLQAILKGGQSVELGDYDPVLAQEIRRLDVRLSLEARELGRYNWSGSRPDRPYLVLVVLGVLGLLGAGGLAISGMEVLPTSILALIVPPSLGLVIGGALGMLITPRRQDARSAQFMMEVDGFRRFLDTDSAAARRQFAQRSGVTQPQLFASLLPYAIAFGLADEWFDSFPELDPDDLVDLGLFVSDWSAARMVTRSVTTSLSRSASTTGGSGFTSGARAGGGGGGGGGGSF